MEEANHNQFVDNFVRGNGTDEFGLPKFSNAERNARDNVFAENRSFRNGGFGFQLGEGIFALNQFVDNQCFGNNDGDDNRGGLVR